MLVVVVIFIVVIVDLMVEQEEALDKIDESCSNENRTKELPDLWEI
jgi:hypothetical protein